MKKFCFVAILFVTSVSICVANTNTIGWNFGNFSLDNNILKNDVGYHFNLGHISLNLSDKYFFSVYLLSMNNDYEQSEARRLFFRPLPFEIGFMPLQYDNWLYAGFYGRTGLELSKKYYEEKYNYGFHGAAGIKLFMFPKARFHYAPHVSFFAEYNVRGELKAGIEIDFLALVYVALLAFRQDYEQRTRYGQTRPTSPHGL
jgi:hypothetical protein